MKFYVLVKPGARKDFIEKMADGTLKVSVKAKPVEGKANESVITLLAEYFGVSRQQIILVSDGHSRHKFFNVKY